MNLRIKARPSHVVLLVVGLVIGMLTVGTAVALTSSSFKYSTPKTGKLSLSPGEFVPYQGGAVYTISSFPLLSSASSCFTTGIHLPNGSRIISIKFFYKNPGGFGDFVGLLFRQNLSTGVGDTMVSVQPADHSGLLKSVAQAVPPTKQTVANGTYAYMVDLCPHGGFGGAIVTYKYFNAGD